MALGIHQEPAFPNIDVNFVLWVKNVNKVEFKIIIKKTMSEKIKLHVSMI